MTAYRDETKQAGQAMIDLSKAAAEALVARGRAERAPQITAALKAMDAPTVGATERWQVFGAAADQMRLAPDEKVLDVVRQSLRGARAGLNVAELAGSAAAVSEVMPRWGAERATDVALALRQGAGEWVEKRDLRTVTQWVEGGVGSAEQGMGLMLALASAGQRPQAMTQLIAKLTEDRPRIAGTGPTERLMREFYNVRGDPQARLKMLTERRDVLSAVMEAQAPIWRATFARKPGDFEGMIVGSEGAVDRALAGAAGIEAFPEATQMAEWKTEAERAKKRDLGLKGLRIEGLMQAYEAQERSAGRHFGQGVWEWLERMKTSVWGPYAQATVLLKGEYLSTYRAKFYGEGVGGAMDAAAAELKEGSRRARAAARDATTIPGGE